MKLISEFILTFKIMNHHVECPELLSLLELNVNVELSVDRLTILLKALSEEGG